MARVVVPQSKPAIGPLPFRSSGKVTALDGTTIVDEVPCAVWPARGRTGGLGKVFDHEGEAHLAYAPELGAANRKLIVEDTTYAIVDAVSETMLPHVALTLREVRPGGGG